MDEISITKSIMLASIGSRLFVIDRQIELIKNYTSPPIELPLLIIEKIELERQLQLLGKGSAINYHVKGK